jgi:hypothetical protein
MSRPSAHVERRAPAGEAKLSGAVLGWMAGVVGVGAVMLSGGPASLPVRAPVLAVLAGAGLFVCLMARRRAGGFPACEIGVVYIAVVSLYALYPLIGFAANGFQFTPFSDERLYMRAPSPAEVGALGWWYAAHLSAFGAAYLLVSGRAPVRVPSRPPERATVSVAVCAYVAITLFFLFLGSFFDLTARTYAASYLVFRQLPLPLAQLANHLGGARFTLELVVLTALFAQYRRWRWLIAAWLALMTLAAFARLGARTEVVLAWTSAGMLYHHLVRPLALRQVVTAGAAGIVLFTVLGFLRVGWSPTLVEAGLDLFRRSSEFEIILGNALDLTYRTANGEVPALPPAFYLTDLLALVPQQLLSLEKVAPAVWYVNTFYPIYAAQGGGLAFGTIAESVVGGGWIDTIGRGAALGLALGLLHRYCARGRAGFWAFVGYLWATALVYQSFRNTTFSLVGLWFYRFLPVAAGVVVMAGVVRAVQQGHGRAAARQAAVAVDGVAGSRPG